MLVLYCVSIYICYACYPSIYCKKLTLRAIILKNTSTKEIFKTARLKTGHTPCLKITKVKLILKPLQNAPIAKWKKPQFSFKLHRIWLTVFEWAKLEKDIKKIFHKNNCHKLNITIEDLLARRVWSSMCSNFHLFMYLLFFHFILIPFLFPFLFALFHFYSAYLNFILWEREKIYPHFNGFSHSRRLKTVCTCHSAK